VGLGSGFGKRLALLLVVLGLVACNSAAGLPLHRISPDSPAALQTGTLVVADGCIYLEEPSMRHRWLVVWPDGYSLRENAVYDDRGGLVGRVGHEVTLGGGEVPKDQYEFVAGKLLNSIPEECRSTEYWMAVGPD